MERGKIGRSYASDEAHSADSLSQPLLFHAAPHDSSPIEENSANPHPISLLRGPRPFRDVEFVYLFLFCVVSTFVFGFCAVSFRNPEYWNVSSFSFDSASSSCVRSVNSSLPANHLIRFPFLDAIFRTDEFRQDYILWSLLITLILAFPILLVLLWLINRYSKQIVYSSIPFYIVIPSIFVVYLVNFCAQSDSCQESFPLLGRIIVPVSVLFVTSLIVWSIFANRHRIELTIKILSISAEALSQNLGLLAVRPSLNLCLWVYYAPVALFMIFAAQNGKIVPKVSTEGHECTWKQHGWVPAYFTLAIVTMAWSFSVMIEAQVYVVSGTISRWYFSNYDERPRRKIRDSFRNAFGPSFGTVCFSGMVMGIVRCLRSERAERDDRPNGIMDIMIRSCAEFLLSLVQFINKFTINFAAITGEGYCSSARMTYELLKRNLLSVIFVETVSTQVLVVIGILFSSVYAILVLLILRFLSAPRMSSYVAAGSSFVLLLVAIVFLIHVLDEVIDTVYVCFAIDRDKGEVSKQEVHSVYALLPVRDGIRAGRPSWGPLLA